MERAIVTSLGVFALTLLVGSSIASTVRIGEGLDLHAFQEPWMCMATSSLNFTAEKVKLAALTRKPILSGVVPSCYYGPYQLSWKDFQKQRITSLDFCCYRDDILPQAMAPNTTLAEIPYIQKFSMKCGIKNISKDLLSGATMLISLDLSSNNISSIHPESFLQQENLVYLNISHNPITQLPPGLFCPMAALFYLDLSHDNLASFPVGVFGPSASYEPPGPTGQCSMNYLEYLNLGSNYIKSIPDNGFAYLFNLQHLNLAQNNISDVNPSAFYNLVHLKHLYLPENRIKYLPQDLFSNTPNLESLLLQENSLTGNFNLSILYDLKHLQHLNLASNFIDGIYERFSHFASVTEINLARNRLTEVTYEFSNATSLMVLNLHNNKIKLIHPRAFSGLKNLTTLNISHNNIVSLPEDLLIDTVSLTTLDISGNSLASISGQFFHALGALKWLDLSNNALTELPVGLLSAVTSLQFISLARNNLVTIPATLLLGLNSLQQVNFSNNKISKIQYESHFSDQVETLMMLDLSNNNLEYYNFSQNSQLDSPRLEYLNISHNHISDFTPFSRSMVSYPALVTLDASHNTITKLTGVWNWPDKTKNMALEKLILNNNNIDTIQPSFFAFMHKLTFLELKNNNLTGFQKPTFLTTGLRDFVVKLLGNPLVCDCNLTWLRDVPSGRLSTCLSPASDTVQPLNDVPAKDFLSIIPKSCPEPCRCLYNSPLPSDASYVHVRCDDMNLRDVPNDLPATTNHLNMSGSFLPLVRADFFEAFSGKNTQLLELDLTKSSIEAIDEMAFKGLYKLEVLKLGGNNLIQFESYMAGSLFHLKEIHLEHNEIEYIQQGALLPTLEVLRLHGNNLKYLQPTLTFSTAYSMRNLTLHQNNWQCDCSIFPLKQWLLLHQSSIDDLGQVQCTAPQKLANMSIVALIVTACPPVVHKFPILLVTLSLGVPLLAILIIVLSMYIMRERIQIHVYNKYNMKIRRRREVDCKPFDVFVSYSKEDIDYVAQILVPFLKRLGYNICVDYENFMSRTMSADNINLAIENSKRTLIVLSHNFLASAWASNEFRETHGRFLRGQERNVVVVMYGDEKVLRKRIHENEQFRDLATYLRMRQCTHVQDRDIYEKLKFFLPELKPVDWYVENSTTPTGQDEDHRPLVNQGNGERTGVYHERDNGL